MHFSNNQMKKYLVLIVVLLSGTIYAQVPQGIPYQAVARNSQGQPLANLNVKVRFSILDSTATGTAVYVESHSVTTSSLGLFSANVGMGVTSVGTFNTINWGQSAIFLKVDLDTTATGNNYIDLGTQQMMSVPYALYAGSAKNIGIQQAISQSCFNCPSTFSNASASAMSIGAAGIFCSALVEGGFSDWRLPTLNEYEYLRDVLNLTTPTVDCWTKDFTILGNGVQSSWTAPVYVSSNRSIMVGGNLNTVCVR